MSGRADDPMKPGKLPAAVLAEILSDLPVPPSDLLLGPAVGEDATAIRIEAGTLVAATDPITLTGKEIGRMAVLVNANDVAVMGVQPRWFLATILIPPGHVADDVRAIFDTLRKGLDEVGAHLVGGHTEVTGVVSQPVVVGQMLGTSASGRFVSSSGASAGDVLVQVGPTPVEGSAVFASEAAGRLESLAPETIRLAADALETPGISVVGPALRAAELGATAMHDLTEGGLAAGLNELSMASDVSLRVDSASVLWFEPGLKVCRVLGADPWATLGSGCFLAAFPAQQASAAVDGLQERGYSAAAIGHAEQGQGVVDMEGVLIPYPERDEVARLLTT